jgi:PadR family transcriptional regulator, regulatory protein AphA
VPDACIAPGTLRVERNDRVHDQQTDVKHMDVQVVEHRGKSYVKNCSHDVMIRNPGDILDLLSFGAEHTTNLYLLEETNFDRPFYDLKSGLAGEIVQKFSNYGVRAVIVGSFNSVQSQRFREFMAESNKGEQLRFAEDGESGLHWLVR